MDVMSASLVNAAWNVADSGKLRTISFVVHWIDSLISLE
jgi:hypothetical protein